MKREETRDHGPIVKVVFLLVAIALILGCKSGERKANPNTKPAQPTTQKAPPIPTPGPLAQPRSLQQTGLPVAATHAAIPADNQQTPDKIALGEKLFFDGRVS